MQTNTLLLTLPLLALATGALIPLQAAANTALSAKLGQVLYVALILFALGFTFIALLILVNRTPAPSITALTTSPLVSYSGGLIVATYVLAITWLSPRMGLGNAICFIVSGQIIAAVAIDHFGLLGTTPTPISHYRIGGVSLMIAGVFLARL